MDRIKDHAGTYSVFSTPEKSKLNFFFGNEKSTNHGSQVTRASDVKKYGIS